MTTTNALTVLLIICLFGCGKAAMVTKITVVDGVKTGIAIRYGINVSSDSYSSVEKGITVEFKLVEPITVNLVKDDRVIKEITLHPGEILTVNSVGDVVK